jgi:hypothetical protein
MTAGVIEEELRGLPPLLYEEARPIWLAMSTIDHKEQLTKITAIFGMSLRFPQKIPRDIAIAHFYMWMSYTLYDRLLDEEVAMNALPVANCLQRLALVHCPALAEAFLRMDAANAWELATTRAIVAKGAIILTSLPNYGDSGVLAERAYGHIANCLELVETKDRVSITGGLSQYVIARQLNDDLHDWVDDFRRGHLSYVVVVLLQAAGVAGGTYDFESLLPQLKRLFWETELERLCLEVIEHIKHARHSLQGVLVASSPFDKQFLEPIARVAHQALQQHHARKEQVAAAYNRTHVQ